MVKKVLFSSKQRNFSFRHLTCAPSVHLNAIVRVRKSNGECIAVFGRLASLTGDHYMLLG